MAGGFRTNTELRDSSLVAVEQMMSLKLEIEMNRRARKYSRSEMAQRVLWTLGAWCVRFSPRPFFAWRRFILRLFGAKIGLHAHVYPTTRVVMPWNLQIGDWSALGEDTLIYNLGKVVIGDRVTISHGAHLCAGTHDYRNPELPLIKARIDVGDDAWLCADSFIGPGQSVGQGAVVGARAVVVEPVEPWTVVAGNPARRIGLRKLDDKAGLFTRQVCK